MDGLFRLLTRLPRLPLALAAAMLAIALGIEWVDASPILWLPKLPLALLLAWAALRPAPTPPEDGRGR